MKRIRLLFLLLATLAFGQSQSTLNIVTFSATPVFDASLSSAQKMTLTGNVTSSTFSNLSKGQVMTLELCQDGTGGRTFTYPTNSAGGATISAGVNACTVQSFFYDGATANVLTGGGGGASAGAFSTLTDGATITWAIASASFANAKVTLAGNRTLNLTGLVNGGQYNLEVIQDNTGGRGLTLGTGCTWKVVNGGTGAIAPTAAGNAIDVLSFTYDGTNCIANFGKNYN